MLKPIESAPHDRFVITFCPCPLPDDAPVVWAHWYETDGYGQPMWCSCDGYIINDPTHWIDVDLPDIT